MLIDGEKLLDFIDELIKQAQVNVADYEEFHGDKLADIPRLPPLDAFLYGVASGKLDQLVYIAQLFEALLEAEDARHGD